MNRLLLPWLLYCLSVPLSVFASDYLPADQAFPLEASIEGESLSVQWDVAEGYYLYRDKYRITATNADIKLGMPLWPAAIEKDDPNFGLVMVDKHKVGARIPIAASPAGASELVIKFQGCANEGLCYPPQTRHITLDWPRVVKITATSEQSAEREKIEGEDQSIADQMASRGTLWILASFFGFGVLLAFTPCVFPMLPIMSSLIVGRGEEMTTLRALRLSIAYVLGMSAAYTVAGIGAALAGRNLQTAMQHPAVLVSFAGVFVLLALSMFGVFQIQLPSALQTRLDAYSRRQQGGTLGGAVVMGVLGALIVGPCVAPPLAGALLYISQSGDMVLGGLALFLLGLGMGLPLIVAGTTMGSVLPRAGQWMDAIKYLFGVFMLMIALLLLDRVFSGTVMLLLWAVLLAGVGVALGGMDFSGQRTGWKRLLQAPGILLLAAAMIELIGAASGGHDFRQPLQLSTNHESASLPITVTQLSELENIIQQSDKPIVADFYADWCTACKDFERKVLSNPQVQQQLSQVTFVTVDVTKANEDAQLLLSEYQLLGPPALISFMPKQPIPMDRTIGEIGHLQFLQLISSLLN